MATTSLIPPGIASEPDGLTAFQIDSHKNQSAPHGFPGHTGYKCMQCAVLSDGAVMIYTPDNGRDVYQDQLLKWNEDCDHLREQHMIHCATPLDRCKNGHWPMPGRPTLPMERIR